MANETNITSKLCGISYGQLCKKKICRKGRWEDVFKKQSSKIQIY